MKAYFFHKIINTMNIQDNENITEIGSWRKIKVLSMFSIYTSPHV